MSDLSFRPRIRWLSTLDVVEIERRLRRKLAEKSTHVKGAIIRYHIILNLPAEEQHFWSPRLEVDLLRHERGVLVSGLMGPKPSIWALVVFAYAFLGFISLFGLVSGLSDLSLGKAPYALIAPAIGLVGGLLLYGSVQGGKRLSRDEMIELRNFLKEVLGEVEEVADDEEYDYFDH